MIPTYNEDNPDQWKCDLREKLIDVLSGNKSEDVLDYIGYAYHCFAPNYIYKYYPDSLDRFNDVKNEKMWYSAPVNFNDIFDCDFTEDKEAVFNSILAQTPNGKGIRKYSKMWMDIQRKTKQALADFDKTMLSNRHTIGVSCFSESCDSLLMWAHYAHNHRGFCVEYELNVFNEKIQFTPVPVIYSDERPCLTSIDLTNPDMDTHSFFITGLTTKASEWSYEKEWRIIRDEGACGINWDKKNKGALLPSIQPSAIILGCESSNELENEVRSYCNNSKKNLYRMYKAETEYRLKKEPIFQFEEETT